MRVSEEPVVEFLNNLWARNRVGIWLSYRPAARLHSTQHGVIGSLESILGLLKSLKIQALFAVVSFGKIQFLLPEKPLLSLYGTEWRECGYGLSILSIYVLYCISY
jgi:hypothetical protein